MRAEGRPYGIPVARVLEVDDLAEVLDVPRALPAMRGVTTARARLVPLLHLGALLGGREAPPQRGGTRVLVDLSGRQVALEVDDADEVVRADPLPVPRGQVLPWALGVAEHREGGLVPILDLDAIGERIA